jgi:hypothetical protein
MDPTFKNELKRNILEYADRLKLEHIMINSFIRQIDYKTQVASTDMAYAISSILDSHKLVEAKNLSSLIIDNDENNNPNKVMGANAELIS